MRLRATLNKPAGHVVDRLQQAMGLHQFVEDFLEKIFHVGFIRHAPADEVAQPGAFFRDDFGDLTVLLDHRGHAHGSSIHFPKTDGGNKYCNGVLTRAVSR